MGQELGTLNIPPRKVVKTLTVGQEVDGVVKRVTEFGAFVDIGVGRDGLVHVSEMSPTRVAEHPTSSKEGDKGQSLGQRTRPRKEPDQPQHDRAGNKNPARS